MSMRIRPARPADAAGIVEIHNAAVAGSTAIWTDLVDTVADREAVLAAADGVAQTVLVAEQDGVVVGYASYAPWRVKTGYRLTVGDSVYVRDGHRGTGTGRALLVALIGHARDAGRHVMIADIESGNTGSIRLHESLGFRICGTFAEVGTKFGRWLDLTILRLELTPGAPAPAAADQPSSE